MSRKLRSSDVLEQLGEPLPLPYIVEASKQKEESEDSILSSQFAEQIKRRKVRIPSSEGRIDYRTDPVVAVNDPFGFPFRLLRQNDFEPDETVLDEIERKIMLMKQDFRTKKDLIADQDTLEEISRTLDEIHSRKHNNSILHELERLQEHGLSREDASPMRRRKTLILVAIAILLLIASFLAGHFSYEYCYYFC